MPFEIGNKFGRMGAPVSDAIRRAALAGDSKRLRAAADRLLDSAAYGESWPERLQAMAFIADRLEGKAVARIESRSDAPREIELADLVRMVLAARTAAADDAQVLDSPALSSPDPAPTP